MPSSRQAWCVCSWVSWQYLKKYGSDGVGIVLGVFQLLGENAGGIKGIGTRAYHAAKQLRKEQGQAKRCAECVCVLGVRAMSKDKVGKRAGQYGSRFGSCLACGRIAGKKIAVRIVQVFKPVKQCAPFLIRDARGRDGKGLADAAQLFGIGKGCVAQQRVDLSARQGGIICFYGAPILRSATLLDSWRYIPLCRYGGVCHRHSRCCRAT